MVGNLVEEGALVMWEREQPKQKQKQQQTWRQVVVYLRHLPLVDGLTEWVSCRWGMRWQTRQQIRHWC